MHVCIHIHIVMPLRISRNNNARCAGGKYKGFKCKAGDCHITIPSSHLQGLTLVLKPQALFILSLRAKHGSLTENKVLSSKLQRATTPSAKLSPELLRDSPAIGTSYAAHEHYQTSRTRSSTLATPSALS